MEHKEGLIVGRNAVLQALESGRTIDSVTVAQGQRGGQAGKLSLIHISEPTRRS